MENNSQTQEDIYYVFPIEDLLSLLHRKSGELEQLEVKWTKDKGYEVCVLYFK